MEFRQHGGDVYRNRIAIDFSINVNPLGLAPRVKQALIDSMDSWERYPDPNYEALRQSIAEYYYVEKKSVLCGNGAAELIFLLVQWRKPKKALVLAPTFSEYEQALHTYGSEVLYHNLNPNENFQVDIERLSMCLTKEIDVFFLCNPNNPTGLTLNREEVKKIADICKKNEIILVVDECFCELTKNPDQYSFVSELKDYKNVMILKAFTKTYAMAGIRLGFIISYHSELMKCMEEGRQPWSISIPAQVAGVVALKEADYVLQARAVIEEGRNYLRKSLENLGFLVYDSKSNYLFFKDEQKRDLYNMLLNKGMLIRKCENYHGLDKGYFRISIRTPNENKQLVEALSEVN